MSVRLEARARAAFALAFVVALVAGCTGKPRFVPPEADSTSVRAGDSLAVFVQQARDQWENGSGDGTAASLTSRLLLDDLRRHPERGLADQARFYLDSLDLGGEVAGGAALVAVNLFARSDPTGGSWPFLFWREGAGVHAQAIDGGGSRLVDIVSRDVPSPALGQIAASQTAILFTRAGGNGPQPLVLVWARPAGGNTWNLAQTLGVDSLGGIGTAQFANASSDSTALVARTYRVSAGFDECTTCPHVYRVRKYRWGPSGFVSQSDETVASPYTTFVQFVNSLAVNDREMAMHYVSDPLVVEAALTADWGRAKGRWRVSPGTEGVAREIVFFRGNTEAYRVHFDLRDGRWLISDFQPTSRSIE